MRVATSIGKPAMREHSFVDLSMHAQLCTMRERQAPSSGLGLGNGLGTGIASAINGVAVETFSEHRVCVRGGLVRRGVGSPAGLSGFREG